MSARGIGTARDYRETGGGVSDREERSLTGSALDAAAAGVTPRQMGGHPGWMRFTLRVRLAAAVFLRTGLVFTIPTVFLAGRVAVFLSRRPSWSFGRPSFFASRRLSIHAAVLVRRPAVFVPEKPIFLRAGSSWRASPCKSVVA
jgi:hypothetical protein